MDVLIFLKVRIFKPTFNDYFFDGFTAIYIPDAKLITNKIRHFFETRDDAAISRHKFHACERL